MQFCINIDSTCRIAYSKYAATSEFTDSFRAYFESRGDRETTFYMHEMMNGLSICKQAGAAAFKNGKVSTGMHS